MTLAPPIQPVPDSAEPPLSEHYEILHAIGRGSFGLVYLARDRAGGLVAVKEFPVSAAVAQSFFRELSIVFALDHPNIVRCLNLFYSHRGRNFLIFEYVEGGTLRDLLEKGVALPLPVALGLMRQICLGLEHAHGRQIVHRDLKPENILLAQGENGGLVPKVADLGLAQYLGAVRGGPGSGDGSPAYMAPEQFYDQVTTASDLYTLGVVFYEILTGRRPFEGPPSRLLLAHLHEPPDLDAIAHPGCRALVGDLLAKQPGSRPASAGAVLARLEDWDTVPGPVIPATGEISAGAAAPCAPVRECSSSLDLLPGCVWQITGPGRTWDVPTAGALHAPAPGRQACVLLAHAHSTDSFDLWRDRIAPGYLTEEIRAVCHPGPDVARPDAPSLLATRRSVREFDPETGRARTLFAHRIAGLRAFAADTTREKFFFADGQRVYCVDGTGRARWNQPNGNYAIGPQLATFPGGWVAATTGPASPALRIFGMDGGVEQGRITLPAPAVALRAVPVTGESTADSGGGIRFQVVLIGLGAEEPARLLTYEGERIVEEIELGEGLFAARWQWGGLLSLYFHDNRVTWRSPYGHELLTHRADATILGDCWLPAGRCVLVLENDRPRCSRVVRLLPVATFSSPGESATATLATPGAFPL